MIRLMLSVSSSSKCDIGHKVGPSGENISDVIRRIDAELVRVFDLLESTKSSSTGKKLSEVVNVMIFSDHGMTRLIDSASGIYRFNTSLLAPGNVVIGSKTGPVLQIYPNEDENVLYDRLKDLHPNVTVYLKKDIPERFYLKRHQRTPPLLLVADKGYVIQYQANATTTDIGFHGYDNELQDMNGIFFAMGPDFQRGKQVDQLRNIELYQMMCHVLGIKAAPNNGTWANVVDVLVLSGGTGIDRSLNSAFPLLLATISTMISSRI